jgi:hypothetical protein
LFVRRIKRLSARLSKKVRGDDPFTILEREREAQYEAAHEKTHKDTDNFLHGM